MSTLYPDLSLTNFPSSVDQFMTFLNIVASDGPLIAQYQQAMKAGNTTLANQILTQIPQGTQKIITATDLNTLSQAMLAVERFYLTDIEPYVQNLQQSWLTTINQFSYKGVWQSGTSYVTNNLVSYTTSGLNLVYIALSDVPVGTAPTNQTYWRLLTIQGQEGQSGEGLSYRQEWNNSSIYSVNDSVTYDGALWMALQPSQNREPSSNPQYWKMVMSLETTAYPIQDTEPTNLQVDGLWFNTSNNPTKYYYLASLTNPATDDNIQLGYQAYDSQGNPLVGTYSGPPALSNPSTYEGLTPTVNGSDLRLSYTFNSAATVQNGSVINFDSPLSNFGNATAAQVQAGATFTSSNGIKLTGIGQFLNKFSSGNSANLSNVVYYEITNASNVLSSNKEITITSLDSLSSYSNILIIMPLVSTKYPLPEAPFASGALVGFLNDTFQWKNTSLTVINTTFYLNEQNILIMSNTAIFDQAITNWGVVPVIAIGF